MHLVVFKVMRGFPLIGMEKAVLGRQLLTTERPFLLASGTPLGSLLKAHCV